MDKTDLDGSKMSITPAVLENGLVTYSAVKYFSAFSASWDRWDDGIDYNQQRLAGPYEPSAAIPEACGGLDHYLNSELYKLQNPNYLTPPSGTVYSPTLVREIVKKYLQYPQYNVFNTDISALEELSAFVSGFDTEDFSATTPTVFKGNINVNLCKCKEDCECKQKITQSPKQEPVPQTNACNCLEEFEREYQLFIEMLRKTRNPKYPDTESEYLSAWEISGCDCEQI